MEYVDSLLDEVQHHIDMMVESYENYIQLLMTIPGVNRKSAIIIISELGIDVSQWSSARKLAAWAGLAPGHNESAGKRNLSRFQKPASTSSPVLYRLHMPLSKIKPVATMQKSLAEFPNDVARNVLS